MSDIGFLIGYRWMIEKTIGKVEAEGHLGRVPMK